MLALAMKHLRSAAILIGLAAYAVAFYATSLPSLLDNAGQPLSRFGMLWQLLWLPEKCLFPNWFGASPQFCLVDRLPVIFVAAVIMIWAAAVGWLVLRILFRVPLSRCVLSRWEVVVFSIAVGLNVLSTWVLLLGLLGVMDRMWMFTAPAIATLVAVGWLRFHSRDRRRRGKGRGKPGAVSSRLWSGCLRRQGFVEPALALAGPAVRADDPAGGDVAAAGL
jgi:hypothetical protein